MSKIPEFVYGLSESGTTKTVIAEDVEYQSLSALLARYPDLRTGPNLALLAEVTNALARGSDYTVILDLAKYEADSRARVEAEAPDVPFVQGVYRLRDFGMPDFSALQMPKLTGDTLTFCAQEVRTGLAYRVVAALGADAPDYLAVPVKPIARTEPPAGTQTSDELYRPSGEAQAEEDEPQPRA